MPCSCENSECIDVFLDPCACEINTGLVADGSGTWKMVYEFNGVQVRTNVNVTNGLAIVVPNVFNEDYKAEVRFYKPDNSIFNETCYKFNIMLTVFTEPCDGPISIPQNYRQMVVMGEPTEEPNNVFGETIEVDNGSTIQFDDLIDAELFAVQLVGSDLLPETGAGVNSFNSTTGTITLSIPYENVYFKIDYKK